VEDFMSNEKRNNGFADILKSVELEDLFFDEDEVKTHYEVVSKKRGYTLKKIKGFTIPSNISVAYVYGKDKQGEYWYVISMRRNEEGKIIPESMHETPCSSDVDAKKLVIAEIRRLMCISA
jgi:hypothetical protein